LIGRKPVNLIVGWCGRFLFFVVPCQFSQDTGDWPENQILIPDWTNFHCPGATLVLEEQKSRNQFTINVKQIKPFNTATPTPVQTMDTTKHSGW